MGNEGNQNLKLDDLKVDNGCDSCVWNYSKITELIAVESFKNGDTVIKKSMLPVENSPCLTCTRFNKKDRKLRFESLRQEASSLSEENKYDRIEKQNCFDNYSSEYDLLNDPEFNQEIRKQIENKLGNKFQELVLVIGRRGSKSFMTTICSLYEAYKLLEMKNPHKRYNLLETEPIGILNVAASSDQADTGVFNKIKSIVFDSPYFIERLGGKPLEDKIYFLTEQNIVDNKKRILQGLPQIPGGIVIKCGHSNASSLVGGTNWCVLMDEVAAMATADGSLVRGVDYQLYEDLFPTIATFGKDGKFFILSQPKGAKGLLYELYQNRKITPSTLVLQLPTWIINPSIPKDWLDEEKSKDYKTFAMQYGAIFGATEAESWIDMDLIEPAFMFPTPRIEQSTNPSFGYFCHIDPSATNDYYVVVVGHSIASGRANESPDVYIDHIHYWKPSSNNPINMELVADYVISLHRKFRFKQVSYDQFNSLGSIQKLQSNGINVICRTFTRQYKESIYDQLYQLFVQNKIFIYTYNTTVIEVTGIRQLQEIDLLKTQFKTLQKKFNGKYYRVEAMSGAHDDIPDAIAAVCYEILSAKIMAKPLPRGLTVYTP